MKRVQKPTAEREIQTPWQIEAQTAQGRGIAMVIMETKIFKQNQRTRVSGKTCRDC
ncbi:hypothetical protein FOHLNKBM_4330 [Methylobacterium longum]|nr:hypothetical protein FOHLNKBM_4330 [Methylobacterium longum]